MGQQSTSEVTSRQELHLKSGRSPECIAQSRANYKLLETELNYTLKLAFCPFRESRL